MPVPPNENKCPRSAYTEWAMPLPRYHTSMVPVPPNENKCPRSAFKPRSVHLPGGRMGDHLSRRAVAGTLVQPTRNSPSEEEEDGPPPVPRRKPCPCLALLPVGVAWPPHCCVRRWSLTPPFHPYSSPQGDWSGMFLWPDPTPYGIPGVTRHRVLRSADFPRHPRRAPRSPGRPGAISS